MFLPYNTDAPIYYRPVITLVMIALNIVIFFIEVKNPEIILSLALETGEGIYPIQWLTCNFLHGDVGHLIGNMIAFWAFGLVVEGKLGWLKTLLVYLGIGIIHGAVVQIIMLGSSEPGLCLGASAIIFGMMAMCMIWAPENSMDCILFVRFIPYFYEIPIKIFVGLYLLLQVILFIWGGGRLSSELLHLVGAITGLVIGLWMLKSGYVNCENWDIFSVWSGNNTMTDIERIKRKTNKTETKQKKEDQIKKRQNLLLEELQTALNNNTPLPAFVIMQKLIQEFKNAEIPEPELLSLIKMLIKNKLLTESIIMMREYLERFVSKEILIRFNLANIFIEANKPFSAKKVLSRIKLIDLDLPQQKILQSLKERAEKKAIILEQQGVYETVEDI
ncbi:MAG: rhomboid family intramembrane serine protease [Planctomycetaceae bacterium]|jgi:membrane associated rhomboid family serine protease|nr:rhomboid family intramembrane serine protease [Planctomycetaceae bacterium]